MRQFLLLWLRCLCFSAAFFPASLLLAHPTGGAVFSDTIRPTITCPASVTLSIPNGACEVEHFYTVMASDNEPGVQVIQTSGLPSGTLFPAGQTVNSFLASDSAGNTATCSFRLTATYSNVSLVCKGEAVVTLGLVCTHTLLSTELLEPGLVYACPANYTVEVDRTPPYGNGPWVPGTLDAADVNKTFQFRVTDKLTGSRCTGNLKPKDDQAPNLLCPEITVSCAVGSFTPAYLRDSIGINDAFPQPADACGGMVTTSYIDGVFLGSCDSTFSKIIRRRWTATDLRGNSAQCTQQIVVQHTQYSDIEYPADVQVDCLAPDLSPGALGEPAFQYNGKMFPVSTSGACTHTVSFKDSTLALCGGSRRILREWSVINWCLGTLVGYTQRIEVADLTPPKVTCPVKPVLSTTATQCLGPVNLPDVVITDDCSRASTIRVYWTVKGKPDSLEGKLENFAANSPTLIDTLGVLAIDSFFPVGLTELRYVATDACGNSGSCTTVLEVWDQTPPVAKCDSTILSVTLGNEGSGNIAATLLDGGSSDLCSSVHFKAKRQKASICFNTGNYEDEAIFCCDDIGDTVLVTLRVYDVVLPAGGIAASFAAGHFSDCTARVLVGDILPPRCVGPPDVTVSCKDFNPNLNAFGDVDSRSCRVHSITQSIDSSQFNSSCRVGQLTRYFRTFDVSGMPGSSCSQRITVNYEQDYYVRFPDDLLVTACSNGASWGEPTFFGVDCERMSVTFTDEVLYVVPDACYKVERTWRVLNTCTNNPNQPLTVVPNPTPHATLNHPSNLIGPVVSAPGTPAPWAASVVSVMPGAPLFYYNTLWSLTTNGYTYKQIINVVDLEKPTTISCPQGGVSSGDLTNNDPNFWNESYWVDQGSNDMRETPIKLNLVARDACAGSDVSIRYLLFLDLENNGVRETVISSAAPPTAGTVLYNNAQNPNYSGGTSRNFDERNVATTAKYRFAMQTTVQNNTKVAQVMWNSQDMPLNYTLPQLPYGQHRIQWTVEDKCGNTTSCEYNFTVAAGPLPQMTCDTSFQLNITPQFGVSLTLAEVLPAVLDHVTPDPSVTFGLRRSGSGSGFPGNSPQVHFGCFDIGNHTVEIWARDPQGRTSNCSFAVSIADLEGYCNNPQPKQVAGRIRDEYGSGVGQVSVTLKSPTLLSSPTVTSDTSGAFFFNATVPAGSPFELVPEKDIAPLNGVSTYDLVLISKHILGLDPITSPYRLIAADGNRSGSITTFDIVEFRKLILGIYTRMPNAPSWRFVPKNFVFSDTLNPFKTTFPETIQVPAIFEDSLSQRFVGIKVGDMNRSTNTHFGSSPEDREGTALLLEAADREVQAGEIFTLDLSAAEVLPGLQFTLEHPGLTLLEAQPGAGLSAEHFALHDQAITAACELRQPLSLRLLCQAGQAGRLSEMLYLSDRITRSEAYRDAPQEPDGLSRCPLALHWSGSTAALAEAPFGLYPSQPNPFSSNTDIGFHLPAATSATFTLYNQQGQMLFSRTDQWAKGYQSIRLTERECGTQKGVLYYRLQTPTHSAMGKMVRE